MLASPPTAIVVVNESKLLTPVEQAEENSSVSGCDGTEGKIVVDAVDKIEDLFGQLRLMESD